MNGSCADSGPRNIEFAAISGTHASFPLLLSRRSAQFTSMLSVASQTALPELRAWRQFGFYSSTKEKYMVAAI